MSQIKIYKTILGLDNIISNIKKKTKEEQLESIVEKYM
jgi:hypothetical protein